MTAESAHGADEARSLENDAFRGASRCTEPRPDHPARGLERDTARAMSEEIVEGFRRAIEAWNRRDVDGWLEQAAPDFEWSPASPAAVERSVYRGDEEVRHAFAAIWETWEVFRFEETEIRDLGDSLLWLGHVHATGRASRIDLDHDFAIYLLVRNGKAIRGDAFLTWQEGLDAAGLRE
jgi:ketosteroid isomerase-like protein